MSAYVCNPEHFGALAALAVRRFNPSGLPGGNWNSVISSFNIGVSDAQVAGYIAGQLAQANIDSVAARYPNDVSGGRPGPCLTDEEIIRQADAWAVRYLKREPKLSIADYFSLCGCYEYQSCEHDGWDKSDAKQQIERIKDGLTRRLPGFSDSPWSWTDPSNIEGEAA